MSRTQWSLLLFAPCLVAGCGVAEYEAQMTRTQARLAYLDEEDQLLGDPLGSPADRPLRLFLRGPGELQARPNTRAAPAAWLSAYTTADTRQVVPPLELYVGVLPRSERRSEIEDQIRHDLKRYADEVHLAQDPGSTGEVVATRGCDRTEVRHGVRYRRLTFLTQETPLSPGGTRAELPAPCLYRYDVYVKEDGPWWVVLIFKILDRDGTERRWREAGVLPADRLKLPILNRERIDKQIRFTLATLRVGPEAEARWREVGGRGP